MFRIHLIRLNLTQMIQNVKRRLTLYSKLSKKRNAYRDMKSQTVIPKKKQFDCSKYNKRKGQSCDLNNLCKYPNCSFKKS
jgi:hypothetical protein